MAKKKSQRTIVGSPLTPTLLDELGALSEFPPSSEDFKPDGNWVNTYRIWTCHGYRESGNDNVGFVRLRRIPDSDKAFALNVHQEIVETDGISNIIEANIKCVKSQLAVPVEWRLSSCFIDANGNEMTQLCTETSGSKKKGVLRIRTGGHTFKSKEPPWLTCDWCILEAIQQLKFSKKSLLIFDMLEGLSVLKENQRLSYRGLYPTKIGGKDIPLHCFVQLGSGILPCEYWLDDRHRLLVVVSMNKVYIFDEQAEKITRKIVKEARKSYEKRKKTQRK